jgi:hypothetical protein
LNFQCFRQSTVGKKWQLAVTQAPSGRVFALNNRLLFVMRCKYLKNNDPESSFENLVKVIQMVDVIGYEVAKSQDWRFSSKSNGCNIFVRGQSGWKDTVWDPACERQLVRFNAGKNPVGLYNFVCSVCCRNGNDFNFSFDRFASLCKKEVWATLLLIYHKIF